MRYYTLLLIFLAFCGKIEAQLIYSDSTELLAICPSALFYEDVERSMTMEKVFTLPDEAFTRVNDKVPNFKHTKSKYWLRVDIENKTQQAVYLILNNPEIRELNVHLKDQDNHITTKNSGTNTLHSTRDLQSSDFTFHLGEKPKTLLLELVTESDFYIPAYLGATPALVSERHYVDLFNGAFGGIIIAMLMYNFFIFFTTKDKIYLYYFLQILSAFLLMLRFRGIGFDLIWFNFPIFNISSSFFICLTAITSVLFGTNFLETRKHTPHLHTLLWIIAGIAGCLLVPAFLNIQPFAIKSTQLLSLILTFVLLYTAIKIHRLGNKNAIYYIIAGLALFFSIPILLLSLNGFIELTALTLGSYQMGIALETILLSNALANKINIYKEEQENSQKHLMAKTLENERLIKEQNVILENKVNARTKELMREKAKTDELLLNILPKPIAEELKIYGKATPRLHQQVSVMFIDIQEFTQYSEEITPEELVEDIDRLFRGFDRIVKRHKVEKIKTIGDAYLCAAGLHKESKEPANDILAAAQDIISFVNMEQEKGKFFNVRVGIHCGSVVAGVVGESKFAYDIWGDTVNVAARMEQNSEIGKINVSQDFYSLVKDRANFEHRGKIEAKNKGEIDMYFCKN